MDLYDLFFELAAGFDDYEGMRAGGHWPPPSPDVPRTIEAPVISTSPPAPALGTLEAARAYVRAGLSVIPVKPDGTKSPALDTWREFRERKPTDAELNAWFGNGHQHGIALVCGPVSRNLEVLDFDSAEVWESWKRHLLAVHPRALDGVPVVRTPGGGRHLYLFRKVVGPNRKVARDRTGKTLIEVRGDGGYVLAPGTPCQCHRTRRSYEWQQSRLGG